MLISYTPCAEHTMPLPEKRTFSLPTEQAGCIDTLVASGSYASARAIPAEQVLPPFAPAMPIG